MVYNYMLGALVLSAVIYMYSAHCMSASVAVEVLLKAPCIDLCCLITAAWCMMCFLVQVLVEASAELASWALEAEQWVALDCQPLPASE